MGILYMCIHTIHNTCRYVHFVYLLVNQYSYWYYLAYDEGSTPGWRHG